MLAILFEIFFGAGIRADRYRRPDDDICILNGVFSNIVKAGVKIRHVRFAVFSFRSVDGDIDDFIGANRVFGVRRKAKAVFRVAHERLQIWFFNRRDALF